MRRTVRALLGVVVVGGLVLLFVLPGRTWLEQSSAMAAAQHRQALLARENQVLAERAAQLRDPAYVARIARAQYGLVQPGQTAYGILPLATPVTTTLPPPTK